MNPKNVHLVFFDSKERFQEVKSQISLLSYRSVNQFENFQQFKEFFESLTDLNEYIVVFIHLVAKTLEGFHSGLKDDLKSVYPKLKINWITRSSSVISPKEIGGTVYCYVHIKQFIISDEIIPQSINEIVSNNISKNSESTIGFDYAIMAALEEDEMEKVLTIIEKEGTIDNDKLLIEYGHLKSNSDKKIVYVSQPSTGMVESAIVATELIVKYNPKFLIMPGVLGGKPGGVNIGDVVIATKVFTIDKGKLDNNNFLQEIESVNTNSSYISKFKRHKQKIIRYIEDFDVTRKSKITLHFDPIACVRQVINKSNYFQEIILSKDRKTIALEMESYGVARACEIVNNGNTIPIIIKSAMDNTIDKSDDAKTYAAWTSAMVIQYILENDLI